MLHPHARRSKNDHPWGQHGGARGLWRATGNEGRRFEAIIRLVVNSFTQVVPGSRKPQGSRPAGGPEIEAAGGVARNSTPSRSTMDFAMGHDGMLYSMAQRR